MQFTTGGSKFSFSAKLTTGSEWISKTEPQIPFNELFEFDELLGKGKISGTLVKRRTSRLDRIESKEKIVLRRIAVAIQKVPASYEEWLQKPLLNGPVEDPPK